MDHMLAIPHAPPIEPGKYTFRAASGLTVEVLLVLDGYVAVAVFWDGAAVQIIDQPAGEA